jgi:hypothetical protein
MRVAPVNHDVDPVEPAFEEALIGLELERVRHDTRGIREHAILGDDGITFDATGRGHHLTSRRESYYYAESRGPTRGS